MNKVLFALLLAVSGLLGYSHFFRETVDKSEYEIDEAARTEALAHPLAGRTERRKAPPAPVLEADIYTEGLHTKGQWRGNPAIADLNGDGILDLVTSVRRWDRRTMGAGIFAYLGTGKNSWTEMIDGFDRMLGYGGASVVDVDGDGKLDIAFSGHDKTPNVYLNFLDDNDRPQWICATPEGVPTEVICSDVALGDFDRDGHVDLVTVGQFPGKGGVFLFLGDGHGEFAREKIVIETAEDHYGAQASFTDIENDGHLELLVALDVGARVYHWDPVQRKAVDEFANHPKLAIMGSELGIEAFDFDQDGVQEILASGYPYEDHAPLRAFKRREDGSWSEWSEGLPSGEGFFDIDIGHLEKDGPPLIFAGGQWGIQLIEMTTPGQFRSIGRIPDTSGIFNLAVGDMTGDGKDDVVWVGQGGVRVYDIKPRKTKSQTTFKDD